MVPSGEWSVCDGQAVQFSLHSGDPDTIERREVSVSISDLRSSEQLFSLNLNGFIVLEFQGPYDDVDWDNKKSVKEVHYPNIVSEIERVVPEARSDLPGLKSRSCLCFPY